MLRNWIGTENLSYLFYDDPDLVRECLEFLTDFITGSWLGGALDRAGFDLYYIHEDMAGKSVPLISPDMFREFFLPHYKTFVAFLKRNGVKNVIVDTDGNFEALIPVFLEGGVEGFGPIERAAGLDPVALRKKYGKQFFMIGGVDKRAIKAGPDAVEEELYRVLPPLLDEGGFIPTVDHSVPPDISLENFEYYLKLKRRIIEGG
jgi:uroporphyrinogen decarboxylase